MSPENEQPPVVGSLPRYPETCPECGQRLTDRPRYCPGCVRRIGPEPAAWGGRTEGYAVASLASSIAGLFAAPVVGPVLYLPGRKAEAEAAVPAELLEKTALVGPGSYLKERIACYREGGVTVLNVTPVAGNPWPWWRVKSLLT